MGLDMNIRYIQCAAHQGKPMLVHVHPGFPNYDLITLNICPNCQQEIAKSK